MASVPADSLPFQAAIDAQDNGSISPPSNPTLFEMATRVDYTRWNKSFPYQLLLVYRDGNKWTVKDPKGMCGKFKYTLPFPPEQLQMSTPFAITTSATQGGVVEEHNAAPFKSISFSGTTGVFPLRGNNGAVKPKDNPAQAIFSGTIANATRTASVLQGFKPTDDTLMGASALNDPSKYKGSGYYQIRLLLKFFEDYAALKKTKDGIGYQLAFAMWKDEAVYLVTPQSFSMNRSAGSPLEYTYSVALKAWGRTTLDVNPRPYSNYKPTPRDPSKLAKLLNNISTARETLANLRDTIGAVAGDLDHALFEPLREASLFAKDMLGVPLSLIDLPTQILQNAKKSIITFIATKEAFEGASATFSNQTSKIADAWQQLADLGSKLGAVEADGANTNTGYNGDSDPGNGIFSDPNAYYPLFDKLQVGQMKLPPSVIAQVAAERTRIRKKTRFDFEQQRDALKTLIADFADAVGAGSATYNATFGRPAPTSKKTPSDNDYQAMYALHAVLMEMNRLAVSSETNRFQLSAEQFVAALASKTDITFVVPQSKFSVPFSYGSSLEELADQYLGSRDRWMEIATLNNLRAPYVDEVGFDLPLLTSGAGNQVMVGDASKLYVGQMVWLSSTSTARAARHITAIRKLSNSQVVLTLDGDPDLARFSIAALAQLHAFLPGTVNSMQTLFIPSAAPSAIPDYDTKSLPGINVHDQLFSVGGIDLLLTPTNDLVVTSDGDGRYAVGLTNIIQDARIKMSVVKGSLPRHPNFGLGVEIGASTVDLDAQELLEAAEDAFSTDPTYTGVTAAYVNKTGGSVQIGLQVGISGVEHEIPLSFNVTP